MITFFIADSLYEKLGKIVSIFIEKIRILKISWISSILEDSNLNEKIKKNYKYFKDKIFKIK